MRDMRLLHVIAVGVAAAAVVAAQAPKPERDWGSHGHDAGAQRYSPLKQINTGNVSNLKVAWTYDTPAAVPPSPARGGAPENEDAPAPLGPARGESNPAAPSRPAPRQSASTPLVIDGVMYLATMYNRVVALDADTGKEIWVKDIGNTPSTRGLAYWAGGSGIPPQLVFGTGDGSSLLISLNAKTGEFAPGFGKGGKVGPAARRRGKVSTAPGCVVVAAGDLPKHRDYRQSLAGGAESRTVGRRARLGSAHRQAPVDVSHDSPAWGAESRRVEKRAVGRSGGGKRLGIHYCRRRARHRVRPAGHTRHRFLRRRSAGVEPLWVLARGAGRVHRKAQVVLSDHSSRQLGLRPDRAADVDRRKARRPHDPGRGGVHEARVCCSSSIA